MKIIKPLYRFILPKKMLLKDYLKLLASSVITFLFELARVKDIAINDLFLMKQKWIPTITR